MSINQLPVMSSITVVTVLSIFITASQFYTATSTPDFLAPLFSPVVGSLCNELGCGKGKCKTSDQNDLQYECECDPGWKQSLFSNQSALGFFPCVIPNCTLNSSCSVAAAPAQAPEIPLNASIFEPCHWAYCGGGVCNKKSSLNYDCECKEGFMNLLNNSHFPCFKECSIGGDCSHLGLTLSNQSTSATPNLPDTGTTKGSSSSTKREPLFPRMIVLIISLAHSL